MLLLLLFYLPLLLYIHEQKKITNFFYVCNFLLFISLKTHSYKKYETLCIVLLIMWLSVNELNSHGHEFVLVSIHLNEIQISVVLLSFFFFFSVSICNRWIHIYFHSTFSLYLCAYCLCFLNVNDSTIHSDSSWQFRIQQNLLIRRRVWRNFRAFFIHFFLFSINFEEKSVKINTAIGKSMKN